MTKPEQRRLAVLGSPITHSRSPLIHRAAYETLGLPWSYTSFECDASRLSAFLDARGPEWRGFSLTMPLKEEAHRIAAVLDPVAMESGVVNTLLRLEGDAGWAGYNTDVAGLANAIERAGLDASHTTILGSGATAVSAVLAARRLGAQRVQIHARNASAAQELAARWEVNVCDVNVCDANADVPSTLIISTLPGSAGPSVGIPEALLRVPLFDVAYAPWPSALALRWQAAGGEAHTGFAMLVEQAIIQVRIFRNDDPNTPLPQEDRVRRAMKGAIETI